MTDRVGLKLILIARSSVSATNTATPSRPLDPEARSDAVDIWQSEQHRGGQSSSDEYEWTPSPSPKPNLVADQANDDLPENPGKRPCRPHDPDFMDVKIVLRGKNPTECRNLDGERKAHCGRRQADDRVEGSGEIFLDLEHGRVCRVRDQ